MLHKYEDSILKAVAHASRLLLLTEKSYSQIEKDVLTIVFEVKKDFMNLYSEEEPVCRQSTTYYSRSMDLTHTANRLLFSIYESNTYNEQIAALENDPTELRLQNGAFAIEKLEIYRWLVKVNTKIQ